jgi:hypothetical protein
VSILRLVALTALIGGLSTGTVAAQGKPAESSSLQPIAPAPPRYEPVFMSGEWEHHADPTLYTGRWEIRIDEEKSDRSFTGTLTYWGFRCNARGAPMIGRRSDKKLTLEARLGVCGQGRFDLDEVGRDRYAGTFAIDDAGAGEKKATLEVRK